MAKTVVAYSDCINVQDEQSRTLLISYSNELDFAGISYTVEPKPVFSVRIEAKFFKERFPEENESEGLSDGSVAKLSGSVKSQKLLQTSPLPYFMHMILKLALQHNYILINNEQWEKEESYEQKEQDEKSPFELGEVWLTVKEEGYINNVFGEVTV